jgi:hypothetical protein
MAERDGSANIADSRGSGAARFAVRGPAGPGR